MYCPWRSRQFYLVNMAIMSLYKWGAPKSSYFKKRAGVTIQFRATIIFHNNSIQFLSGVYLKHCHIKRRDFCSRRPSDIRQSRNFRQCHTIEWTILFEWRPFPTEVVPTFGWQGEFLFKQFAGVNFILLFIKCSNFMKCINSFYIKKEGVDFHEWNWKSMRTSIYLFSR